MGDSHVTFFENNLQAKKHNNNPKDEENKQTSNALNKPWPPTKNYNLSPSSTSSPNLKFFKGFEKNEKDILMQHHHDLSTLCRDLEQHKLDMQRQHLHSSEALRNSGATTQNKLNENEFATDASSSLSSPPSSSSTSSSRQRGDKLRTRKEGRDEHGMNGASSYTIFSLSSSPTFSSSSENQQKQQQHDILEEELASESVDEAQMTEIPELPKSVLSSSSNNSGSTSCGLPQRTIPFRSASFSQVDITSEGKYVRNPKSPITLKPTAFCLMNTNSYASGSSTLPRSYVKHHHHQQQRRHQHHLHPHSHHHRQQLISSCDSCCAGGGVGGDCDSGATSSNIDNFSSSQMSPPILSHHSSCGGDGVSNSCVLSETIVENDISNEFFSNCDLNNADKIMETFQSAGASCNQMNHCNTTGNHNESTTDEDKTVMEPIKEPVSHLSRVAIDLDADKVSKYSENTASQDSNSVSEEREEVSMPPREANNSDINTERSDKPPELIRMDSVVGESCESEKCEDSSASVEEVLGMEKVQLDAEFFSCEDNKSTNNSILVQPPSSPLPPFMENISMADGNFKGLIKTNEDERGRCLNSGQKSISFSDEDKTYPDVKEEPSADHSERVTSATGRPNKPQLVRSPPLIREESIMARSSSEEGPKSDIDEERADKNLLVSSSRNPCLSSSSMKSNLSAKGRKHKKHVLLDLEIGGGSSISGSGGEEDPERDKRGLYRQSSGQSDESGEGDRTSDGCTSPPITNPHTNPTLNLHRSHLSPGNSPLTEALALDPVMRRGSVSQSSQSTHAPTAAHSASNLHSTSLPQTSSVSTQSYFKGSSDNDGGGGLAEQRDNDRMSSLSSPNVNRQMPPRRFKKPLRGPYGEMLEAEMNKVVAPRPNRDYDSFEFWRESKSSSPSRTPKNDSDSVCGGASGSRNFQNQTKLSNYLMSSMDDLNNLSKQKHSNNRARKISANLPVSHYHTKEDGTPIAFHQRTASSPSQLLYAASSSEQDSLAERRQLDASPRGHVLAEIVETEKSYVDSLRILVKKYMEPLKASDIIDNGLVDEIFFQIPAILRHHEQLLDDLQHTVTDDNQCIGNVLLDTFRKKSLLDCYSLFVNNWKNAKGSLKMAVASKPPLARFLESQARQHKGKLSIDSLLIMPIQRIPRYELLVKELVKHTDPTHEDHSRLVQALEMIKRFAVHIDCASVDPNGSREIEIEGWGSGLGHLVRQDVVTLSHNSSMKKEKALFLFADSLVVASIKRKSMRKPPQGLSAGNNLDGCKFKLVMKIQLTDVHIVNDELEGYCSSGGKSSSGGASGLSSTHNDEIDDLKTIHKMMDLATLLKCPHVGLDEVLKDLASGLKHHCDNNADVLDLEIRQSDTGDTPEALKIYFGSADKKNSWIDTFQDTVGKFIRYGFGKLPQVQFIQALPIRKTRAGLQLSCAAPVTLFNKVTKTLEMTDLWVANSDGYVGQICILTLYPEPAITSCNGVCNSRITCIISVPPACYPHWSAGTGSYHPDTFTFNHDIAHHSHLCHALGYESEDDHHRSSSKQSSKNPGEHWSVWLGTEDGSLHVYDCSDSVRVKKNRHKVQHKSPLNSMIYFNRRVFVALGNGDVAVYSRNPKDGKGWLVNEASWVTIGTAMNPVTKMICVHSYIWCACGSQIKIYGENNGMLELIQTIQIVIEGNQMPRGVSAMVSSDTQVWVAVQSSSIIKSYSITTYECLTELNVAPDVAKILAGCDDIIRQHKSACLRVTALLVAPDKSLWIGTSAGVLLTIASASQLPPPPYPRISILGHGHTGQVRFLTSCVTREAWTVISGGDGYEEFRSVPAYMGNNGGPPSFTSMVSGLVSEASAGDLSGREDSTNHLLIWKIPKYM